MSEVKRIYTLLVLTLFFSACTTTLKLYRYGSYQNNPYSKIFNISGSVVDIEQENSELKSINVYDREYKGYVKFLSSSVEIVDEQGKNYTLTVEKGEKTIYVHKQGVRIQGPFKAKLGKVLRKDGMIVDIPPLVFKKYVDVDKWNPILDTMNIETGEQIFSGTVEEYKKGDWKEQKKRKK